MARYIDADIALEKMKNWHTQERLMDCVRDMPAADVVQVVLCKDCKHATFYSCKNDACYKGIICEYEIGTDDENFYCAYGEARTPKERGGEK